MSEPEYRTITMTGRPPLLVRSTDWPLIASDRWWNGEHECQANEVASIRVRQHADGRTIVYATRGRGPGGMPIEYYGARAGELLPDPGGTCGAIRRVAEAAGLPDGMADRCIADLPAETI